MFRHYKTWAHWRDKNVYSRNVVEVHCTNPLFQSFVDCSLLKYYLLRFISFFHAFPLSSCQYARVSPLSIVYFSLSFSVVSPHLPQWSRNTGTYLQTTPSFHVLPAWLQLTLAQFLIQNSPVHLFPYNNSLMLCFSLYVRITQNQALTLNEEFIRLRV